MTGPLNKKDDSPFCLKRGRMVSNSPTIDQRNKRTFRLRGKQLNAESLGD